MFAIEEIIRENLLGIKVDPNRKKPPLPTVKCYQQGRLILTWVDELPEGAVKIAEAGPGEILDLGDGHQIHVACADDT